MPSGKYRHIIRLIIRLSTPLTIEETVLREGLDILKEVLSQLPDEPDA